MESQIKKAIQEIRDIGKLDPTCLEQKVMKFNEEFGECNAEILKLLGYSSKNKPYDKDHLIEEMADTLQNLLYIFIDIEDKTGISLENDILPTLFKKNQKWETNVNEKINRK